MIDTLITYLPFYRIHEIKEYFLKNVDSVSPQNQIVYVDNVFHKSQIEFLNFKNITIKTGNWRDRSLTYLQILKDLRREPCEALIVDSDNVLKPNFQALDDAMLDAKFDFYTIIDQGAPNWNKFLNRSRLISELNVKSKEITVYSFRIPGFWRGIFFIGPKQAVRLSKNLLERIDAKILQHVELALNSVEPELRQYLSDETVLGTILYYSGIKWIPWLEYSVHYTHGSIRESNNLRRKLLVAMSFSRYAESLALKGYKRAMWMFARYKLTQIAISPFASLV